MKKQKFFKIIISFLSLFFLVSIVYAIPVPHGIDGVIYELDGITQVRNGIDFYVHDATNGQIISGKTGYGSSGRYSVSLKGNDGDIIVIKAWNKFNQVNATLILNGVMRNVNLFLNMTFPPIAPNITSQPVTNAIEDELYTYQIEAFDENDDLLEYSLLEGPLRMGINKSSGLISWLPTNEDVGNHNIIVQVSDGIFEVNQSFNIEVQNVNDAPIIISIPAVNATQDVNYFYDVDAIDEDDNILIYSLIEKPDGMIINALTGLINWPPNNSQIGINHVIVEVSDGNLTDRQEFMISVANVNDLPVISSLPVTKAIQDKLYNYDVEAYDIDNDTLNYSLVNYPAGMKINKINGAITWLPNNFDVGIHHITIKVADDIGFVLQPFALLVENVNDKPVINSTPITEAKVGKTYTYDVDAYDADNDLLVYSLVIAPEGMEINKNNGIIEWKPKGNQMGNNIVIVEVSDGNLTYQQEFSIIIFASEDKEKEKKDGGSSTSGSTASGSSGGSGSGSGNVLESLIKELEQEEKSTIIGIKTKSLNVILKVEELNERPQDAARISKRVYRYLKIENVNNVDIDEAIINFTVDLEWLNQMGIEYDDIVLSRHTNKGWQDLATENVSKDSKFVYYIAKTHNFSYFAISVKEGVSVKSIPNPQISKIEVPHRIAGIIYKFGKFKQVDKGTKLKVENLNTSEVFVGETGIGPYSGGYYLLMHGKEGDLIKITIKGIDDEYLTTLTDRDLDFMVNHINTGFTAITGNALFLILSDSVSIFTIILFIAIILTAIFIKFNKRR